MLFQILTSGPENQVSYSTIDSFLLIVFFSFSSLCYTSVVSIKLHVNTNHADPQDDAKPELAEFSDTDLVERLPRHHRIGQVREGEGKEHANFIILSFYRILGLQLRKQTKRKRKRGNKVSIHKWTLSLMDQLKGPTHVMRTIKTIKEAGEEEEEQVYKGSIVLEKCFHRPPETSN